MTIQEVYEKYQHMDEVFSEFKMTQDHFLKAIIWDLWWAIKEEVIKEAT